MIIHLEKMIKEKTDKELAQIIDDYGFGYFTDGYEKCRETIFKVLKEYAEIENL